MQETTLNLYYLWLERNQIPWGISVEPVVMGLMSIATYKLRDTHHSKAFSNQFQIWNRSRSILSMSRRKVSRHPQAGMPNYLLQDPGPLTRFQNLRGSLLHGRNRRKWPLSQGSGTTSQEFTSRWKTHYLKGRGHKRLSLSLLTWYSQRRPTVRNITSSVRNKASWEMKARRDSTLEICRMGQDLRGMIKWKSSPKNTNNLFDS